MLRRLNVSAKVRAVLVVPMIVLLVAGTYIGWGSYQTLHAIRVDGSVVKTLADLQDVADALRTEQAKSEGTVDPTALAQARAATDGQVSAYQKSARSLQVSALPTDTRAAYAAVNDALTSTLTSARTQVDNNGSVVSGTYESIFDKQLQFVQTWADETTNRPLAAWLSVHADLLTMPDAVTAENRAAQQMFSRGVDAVRLDAFRDATAQTQAAKTTAGAALDAQGLDGRYVQAETDEMSKFRSNLLAGTAARVDPAAWANAVKVELARSDSSDRSVLSHASALADKQSRTALIRSLGTLGVLLVVFFAAWVIASVVARSIVRPLRRLTDAAGEVREQLPRIVQQVAVPGEGPDIELPRIPVESDDEVGRLAAAFNDVNATTIQVAQEQAALRGSIAEMFINVARRDQVLLNRQLAFVDSLERSEEDPTVLANLFHLDHLATRMRRNAESLLVLAGIDSGRRLRESMPLSDVIRTASSEIEQYDRVELDLNVDPLMLGFNALPAAHLLAELLENASVFSEPDTPVEVSTGLVEGFVVVTVLDHGIGMTDGELDVVNEKLRSNSPADALGAQRLGLFVVARLARRLGAQLDITHAPDGAGTRTTVRFPVALFADLDAAAPQQPAAAEPGALLPPLTLSPAVPGVVPPAAPAPVVVPPADVVPAVATAVTGLPQRRPQEDASDPSAAFVLPPAITPLDLHTDLAGGGDGFTPMMAATSLNGLPTRRREQDEPVPLSLELPPTAPIDPESRRGLFTGFRGRTHGVDEATEPAAELPGAPVEQPAAELPAVEQPAVEQLDAELPAPELPAVEQPAAEPVAESPAPPEAAEPVQATPAPVASTALPSRRHRGAHAAPVADVPFGHTADEVAVWTTGAIPVVVPEATDPDWPDASWDAAPWPPAGLFAYAVGDGHLVPAFDPIALEPEDDEEPYHPLAVDADAAPIATRHDPVPARSGPVVAKPEPVVAEPQPALVSEPWPPAVEFEPEPEPEPVAGDGATLDQVQPDVTWPAVFTSLDQEIEAVAPVAPSAPDSLPVPVAATSWPTVTAAPAVAPADDAVPGKAARRRRFGLFGRKDEPAAVSVPTATAWSPVTDTAADTAWSAPARWPEAAASRSRLEPADVPAQQPSPTESAPSIQNPTQLWPGEALPVAAAERAVATGFTPAAVRPVGLGTLDADVASMLALRSDIEEQALAELSQLSAYRPSMSGAGDRLVHRVPVAGAPVAMPAAVSKPITRDADELRARLASFQSGTSRGRRTPIEVETEESRP